MNIGNWFIPKDKVFFDLFERQAAIVTEAAHLLVALTKNFSDIKEKQHEIEVLEHRGDQITHDILYRLNTSRHPPFDPNEISKLASALDEVLDYIDATTERMLYYHIESTDMYMVELAKLIYLATVEIEGAVKALRSFSDPQFIQERCIEINRLENLADDELARALTDLFQKGDALTVIKLKDIYEYLELGTDYCEDVSDILNDIARWQSSN